MSGEIVIWDFIYGADIVNQNALKSDIQPPFVCLTPEV